MSDPSASRSSESDTNEGIGIGPLRFQSRLELLATVVLTVATLLTAWSAFQSGKWSGVQATSFSEAGATRTESSRASTTGGQLATIDVTLFSQWADAASNDNFDLADFWFERFRDEFKPAMEAWIGDQVVGDPNVVVPDGTPFELDEYVLADIEEADRLAQEADDKAATARQANQRSDNYVLSTVLFASVLLFAGIATKFESTPVKLITLTAAVLLLVAGAVTVLTFPIEI
jgi:hypothetical protein